MSDFLSKFSGQNYDELLENDRASATLTEPNAPTQSPPVIPIEEQSGQLKDAVEEISVTANNKKSVSKSTTPLRSTRRYEADETYEVDPSFQGKQKKKRLIAIILSLVSLCFLVLVYYKITHVTLPNFIGKSVTDARAWGIKNNVDFALEQTFSLEQDVNQVIDQEIKPNKSVKKRSTVTLIVSLGADPDEKLTLPDFEKMSLSQVEKWISEHKADNLILKQEFNDSISAGQFIRLDIISSGVVKEDYRRGNKANLYYSRGQEKFEKSIEIPDFSGKTKSDVDSWAKKNDLKVTYTEQASDSIAAGTVLNQSVASGEKLSKKDAFEVFISAGKGIAVPNFATLTPEAASTAPGLTVTVQYQYNPNLRYGTLISQSIEAGKQLTEKEGKSVLVIYSQGAPYLKDIRGKNASELAKYFFDEFQSKSAEVTYETYWTNSAQPRGTVVEQSEYETQIPMKYHVYLGISNGALSNQPSNDWPVSSETTAENPSESVTQP